MRRIRKASIKYLSLCPRGANRMAVLYKAEEKEVEFSPLCKFDESLGEVTAVVYAPEHRDADGDIASADVIKEMAYTFGKNGAKVDLRHNEKQLTADQAYVAESFLIQKGDPRFADFKDKNDKAVDVTGGWGAVIKIEDPALKQLYKDGKWDGISMFGPAILEPDDSALEELVKKLTQKGTEDMDDKKLTEVLQMNNLALVEAITKALTPPKTEETKTEPVTKAEPLIKVEKPEFKGSWSSPEDVKKYNKDLKKYNLAKTVDFSDDKAVENYLVSLEKIDKNETEEKTALFEDKSDDDEEKKLLKEELRKALKKSNQPASESEGAFSISKEDKAKIDLGHDMAKFINESNGRK